MNLNDLPDNLPVPIDNGAADHLESMSLPGIKLGATNGDVINIGQLTGYVVLYLYPMTGRPDRALPDNWDEIPGARGCTPQSCSFRDHHQELQQLKANVFGISVQSSEYQQEAKSRLHLPFELLSDESLTLRDNLNLPTFYADGMELYKRITLITRDAVIEKVHYPVFPSSEDADNVINWLKQQH